MKIAYLVNQYPKVSHSFVRREIAAVEQTGIEVNRYTVRGVSEPLRDPADESERHRTQVLLKAGAGAMASALGTTLLRRPRRTLHALGTTVRIGARSERGIARHLVYLAESALLLKWLERDGCRHVHAHFGTNSATVAMLCHELGGPSFSFTVHGPEEFDMPGPLALPRKVEQASFVAAVSQYGRAQLLRLTESEQWSKVHVVPCGVEASLLEREPAPVPAAPRLVCVGRLCAQKAQLLLVEATARLRAEGLAVELVLVGDGEMRGEVEAAVAKHGLGEAVRITGWASGSEVLTELTAARALVLPSFAEGLPVVIMEAFALGRPVISTFVAGIPELVEPGQSGWLVPAGNTEALVAAMRAAVEAPPELLSRMGLEGRRRVMAGHDATASGRQLAALFHGATP